MFELRDAAGISMVIRHFEEYRDKLRSGSIAPAGALHYCTLLHRWLFPFRDPGAEIPDDLPADAAAGWRAWFGTVRSTLK